MEKMWKEVAVAYSRTCLEKLKKTTSDLSRTVVIPAEILTGHLPNISHTRYRLIQVAGRKKQTADDGNEGECNKVKIRRRGGGSGA
jgi:hypothetical protein